jgi:hypothetical protein
VLLEAFDGVVVEAFVFEEGCEDGGLERKNGNKREI